MMHSWLRRLTALGMLLVSQTNLADPYEIQHLLEFVKNTPCTYERNGTQHSGTDAVEHIKKKYAYFEDDIQTTEDFIELSATKSTMSGQEYQVHCPNKKAITSKQWLLDELHKLREPK